VAADLSIRRERKKDYFQSSRHAADLTMLVGSEDGYVPHFRKWAYRNGNAIEVRCPLLPGWLINGGLLNRLVDFFRCDQYRLELSDDHKYQSCHPTARDAQRSALTAKISRAR